MKVNLDKVASRDVKVGDLLVCGHKGMGSDVYLLVLIDGKYMAINVDGDEILNGSHDSIRELINDLRTEPLIESIHTFSRSEYQLTVEPIPLL